MESAETQQQQPTSAIKKEIIENENQQPLMESRQICNNKGVGQQQQSSTSPTYQQQQHFFQSNPSGFVGNNVVQQPQQQTETMQAFANLGLFCPPNAHQQFTSMPSAPAGSIPPHLAASLAAGYGQRLMGGGHILHPQPQQNGSTTHRNGFSSNLAPSSSSHPSAPSSSISSSSSINRSQRCGVCRGCQCKPCGQCTYCQDSPQFGGPGVKKQSCVERRCLRVLENRLQRDAPTFKARIGCNACEDCRGPDCRICLVCLDRRFFNSKYMAGALCAKKRCNNATALELPISIEHQQRTSLKRSSDGSNGNFSGHQQAKRQVIHPPGNNNSNGAHNQVNSNIARILSAAGASESQQQQQNQKFNNNCGTTTYGRSSGGNNTSSNNSPLSDNSSNSNNNCTIQTPPSLMSTQQQQQISGRSFWPSNQQTQMLSVLPGHYQHFDQMASLAAVAAGFPQQQMSNGSEQMRVVAVGNTQQQQQGDTQTTAENLLVPPSYSDMQKVVLQPL
uniref:CXXC-type domain-containing protein n=1 Tax=Meloidogyne hapla TaxID=6305 RepID=A0A1I8BS98_MELHA